MATSRPVTHYWKCHPCTFAAFHSSVTHLTTAIFQENKTQAIDRYSFVYTHTCNNVLIGCWGFKCSAVMDTGNHEHRPLEQHGEDRRSSQIWENNILFNELLQKLPQWFCAAVGKCKMGTEFGTSHDGKTSCHRCNNTVLIQQHWTCSPYSAGNSVSLDYENFK